MTYHQKLDEILLTLAPPEIYGQTSPDGTCTDHDVNDRKRQETKAAINQLVKDEVIGKDEPDLSVKGAYGDDEIRLIKSIGAYDKELYRVISQNQLRNWQRKIIKTDGGE